MTNPIGPLERAIGRLTDRGTARLRFPEIEVYAPRMLSLRTHWMLVGLLGAAACAKEARNTTTTTTRADAGVMDSGSSDPIDSGAPGTPDSGTSSTPDSGGGTIDSGTTTSACDPSTGGGCTNGQTCIFVYPSGPACVTLAGTLKAGFAQCAVAANECPAGFSCLPIDTTTGACAKICDIGGNECASYQDEGGKPLLCNQDVLDSASGYGVCAPQLVECVIFSDTCPQGQHCDVVSQAGATSCLPVAQNAAAIGAACQPGGCQRGGTCLNLGSGGVCYKPCETSSGTGCGQTEACSPIQGPSGLLPFGVCQASATCTPLNDTCPQNQMCAPISQTAFGCTAAGTRNTGETCGGTLGQCVRGHMCAGAQGQQTTCFMACDASTTCPNGTTCNLQALQGASFGLCM
ncbi:MAG: hypothetical protein HYV07_30740 [Deltaproteobacteria bacterium]|nr:hypothetical protein [Deltaproteobacteria bacterium]